MNNFSEAEFLTQYEAAVILVLTQNSSSQVSEVQGATAFIQSIASHPDGQLLCLRLLMTSKRPEARFFCLQALSDIALVPFHVQSSTLQQQQQRELVRSQILLYAFQRCSAMEEDPPFDLVG